MREILLVFHILGAALWIGGGIATLAARKGMMRRGTAPALQWMDFEESLGKTFFPLAAVVTLLSGVGLVLIAEQFGFLDIFVVIGIVAFLVSSIGNAAYVGKSDTQAVAALREGREDEGLSLLSGATRFHILDNAVLVLALIAMVYRWGS